jgi:hypothetical protein
MPAKLLILIAVVQAVFLGAHSTIETKNPE